MRGSGKSQKNIYLALMSDHIHNYILAPTEPISYHLFRMFDASAGKWDRQSQNSYKIGDRYYHFRVLRHNVHQIFFGLHDQAVFPDHSCFEPPHQTEETMQELKLINEIILTQRAIKNGNIRDNSGKVQDPK